MHAKRRVTWSIVGLLAASAVCLLLAGGPEELWLQLAYTRSIVGPSAPAGSFVDYHPFGDESYLPYQLMAGRPIYEKRVRWLPGHDVLVLAGDSLVGLVAHPDATPKHLNNRQKAD